jgi:hypothetical protein
VPYLHHLDNNAVVYDNLLALISRKYKHEEPS